MSSRSSRLVAWVGVASLAAGLGIRLQARGPANATAVVVGSIAARERATGTTSLVVSVVNIEDLPSPRRLDQLVAQLPTDRPVTPGSMPEGWRLEQKGKQVRTWGPAVDNPAVRFDLSGDFSKDYVGKQATLQFGLGGRLDTSLKLMIGALPKVTATSELQGLLTIPPQGTVGEPLVIGVAPAYRAGNWRIATAAGLVPMVPLEQIRNANQDQTVFAKDLLRTLGGDIDIDTLLKERGSVPYVTRFADWGRAPTVTYTDPWGEVTVDAPLAITPVPLVSGARALFGATTLTFAGQPTCVSGRFPRFNDAFGLLLDGKTPLQPWGWSGTTAMLGIPEGTPAGSHTISDAGGSSSVTVGVLTVQASLDQNKLWRGESTALRLRVAGTDRAFPIALLNRTPAIVLVEGGASQTVTTSGGADNVMVRSVKGIQRGDFAITYTVDAPGCGAGAP